ncbi:MAG: hypothetical protein QE271_01870 [Bacteriovoracaceae bacterium]|nr:hypothetical protein [Bacteriovoracaceae bacterium]
MRLANNKLQVSRSNDVKISSIEIAHPPEYQKQMTTLLNSDGSIAGESAAPIFIKSTIFDATFESPLIPKGFIKVSCKEVVQAPSFDVLK